MRRRLIWMLLLTAPLITVMSCGSDEDPPSGISFELMSEEVNESNGTLTSFNPDDVSGGVGVDKKVKLVFDRPMAENAVISYTVTGTANKKDITTGTGSSASTSYTDFYLEGTNAKDTETLVINKGDTEAYITLTVFEDFEFEVDDTDASGNFIETIVLTLTSVVSGPASLGTDNQTYTLTIKEDDSVFILGWEPQDGKTDVDIDIIAKTGGLTARASANESTDGSISTGGEGFFTPAGYPDGTYNFSYPYYSGTSNNVKFNVYMLNTAGTLNGKSYSYSGTSALTFSGVYKLVNINKYTDFSSLTYVAQTMIKSGINYTNISAITVPASSSRTSSTIPSLEGLETKNLKLNKDQIRRFTSAKPPLGRE